jgi:aldehyde dehydrogenase
VGARRSSGRYFDVVTPITRQGLHPGRPLHAPRTSSSRSTPLTPPADKWGTHHRRPSARNILLKIADRIEANLEELAVCRDGGTNGKPIRETLTADIPLAVDHFRYFAGALRAQEGSISRDRRRPPSPITSTSRWAWSGRSSRGTSRS